MSGVSHFKRVLILLKKTKLENQVIEVNYKINLIYL